MSSILKPVAILTCKGMEHHGKGDDAELIEMFRKKGTPAEYIIWDAPEKSWDSYSAVIIRSTWDYYQGEQLPKFLETLRKIESVGTPLFNSYSIVAWNCRKNYLQQLKEKGVLVLDTEWILRKDLDRVPSLMQNRGWKDAILKPTLSAGGDHIQRLRAQDEYTAPNPKDPCPEWMLQPFADEITEEGEWSFVFLNGKFSHAALKKPSPKQGDFLVQTCHGGRKERKEPETWRLLQAQEVYEKCPQGALFARIDGFFRDQKLFVGEVEMIEPELYFGCGDRVAEKLYEAFEEQMASMNLLR